MIEKEEGMAESKCLIRISAGDGGKNPTANTMTSTWYAYSNAVQAFLVKYNYFMHNQ